MTPARHRGILLAAASLALAAMLAGCSEPEGGSAPDAGPRLEPIGYPDAGTPECVGCDGGGEAPDAAAGSADAGVEVKVKFVSPGRGPTSGGTLVTLQGGGFYKGFADGSTEARRQTKVFFGQAEAGDFRIIDDDTLEVTSPPFAQGAVDVAVENPNGRAACAGCFTYFTPLALDAAAPSRGPLSGGTEVALSGDGFEEGLAVLFGGRPSPKVSIQDGSHAIAVSPAATAPGTVNLRAYGKNGVRDLRRAFTYEADLLLERVEPPYGPLEGGGEVRLVGAGLASVDSVRFGGAAATFTFSESGGLRARVPAATASGPVDVVVARGARTARLAGGFVYFDPAEAGPAIAGVVPAHGPDSGGNEVTLVGSGLQGQVLFGLEPAAERSASEHARVVEAPPGPAGTRVDVHAGSATLASAYRYDLALTEVSPSSGSGVGGQEVLLRGRGFREGLVVRFGPLAAAEVALVDESTLRAKTPPGAGGAVDVEVFDPQEPDDRAVLAAGYRYLPRLAVGSVTPGRGAIAGGTYVTVMGQGFEPGVVIELGGSPLRDLKVVDATTVIGRTPPADPGIVDLVAVRGTERDVSAGAFSYFDPKSGGGGSTGGPLRGTLNVTILDNSYGRYGSPLPGVTVMLGTDPATRFQGQTDRRGQVTLSDPAIAGPQLVTAHREGREAVTVVDQASENLTLFLSSNGAGAGSGQPALISGRVTGFKLPRELKPGETAWAEVYVAPTTLFSTPPLGWVASGEQRTARGERWKVLEDGGLFTVMTGDGTRAIYAVYGIWSAATETFTPVLLGVRRSVTATAEKPAWGQDIVLDTHLDTSVPVTIENPLVDRTALALSPGGLEPAYALNQTFAWLELGGQGVIPLGSAASRGPTLTLHHLPPVDGGSLVFLNQSTCMAAPDTSYAFRRQLGPVEPGVTVGPMPDFVKLVEPARGQRLGARIAWQLGDGPAPGVLQLTTFQYGPGGYSYPWTVIAPGTARAAPIPGNVLESIRRAGGVLMVNLSAGRSPRFDWAHWTYSHLSYGAWTSWTETSADLTP